MASETKLERRAANLESDAVWLESLLITGRIDVDRRKLIAAAFRGASRDVRAAAAEIARLTRELEETRRERSAAKAEALNAQASLRRVERELEEARVRERALREALELIAGVRHTMDTSSVAAYARHALAARLRGEGGGE